MRKKVLAAVMSHVRIALLLGLAANSFAALPGVTTEAESYVWSSGTYRYDGAGNIITIDAPTSTGVPDYYVYDPVGRLTWGSANTPEYRNHQEFSFDMYGNLLRVATVSKKGSFNASPDDTRLDVIPGKNQLGDGSSAACAGGTTCISARYDEAGNQVAPSATATAQILVAGQWRTVDPYVFDGSGMMTELHEATRHELYVYDSNNERVARVITTATGEQRLYMMRGAGASVLREYVHNVGGPAAGWSWNKDYVYRGGQLLAAELPGDRRQHFHLDHLGTPRLITDDAGYMVATHTYFPFGMEAPGSVPDTERLKFTGHERDLGPDHGRDLDYMHARFYWPASSRFLSVDPVITKLAVRHPQLWNRYAYVGDNPINRVDPDGRVLQLSECARSSTSAGCKGQYDLLVSTFGKQAGNAAKHLAVGKNGIVTITGMSGTAFASKFGAMGRATNYLVSNRAATFTMNTGRTDGAANFVAREGGGGAINVDVAAFRGGKMLGGVKVSATEALVHEMAHAVSTLIPGHAEALNLAAGTSILTLASPRNEAYATVFENAWRRATFGPESRIRDGYATQGDVRDLSSPLFP